MSSVLGDKVLAQGNKVHIWVADSPYELFEPLFPSPPATTAKVFTPGISLMAPRNGTSYQGLFVHCDIESAAAASLYIWIDTLKGSSLELPQRWIAEFGAVQGGWRVGVHPRVMANVNGDQRDDIVGFGHDGVLVSLANVIGDGFRPQQLWVREFGYDQGWRGDRHPRMMADVNGDGRQDVVGFGDDGVWVSLAQDSDGTIEPSATPVLHRVTGGVTPTAQLRYYDALPKLNRRGAADVWPGETIPFWIISTLAEDASPGIYNSYLWCYCR